MAGRKPSRLSATDLVGDTGCPPVGAEARALPRTCGWAQLALEDAGFESRPEGFAAHLFGTAYADALPVLGAEATA